MTRTCTPPGPTRVPPGPFADGRDELNLADFPISVLRRRQPEDADGRKLDQVVYESSTYDPVNRRRVPQRVTLTTSSRCGLPTPADENVILALLYTAKHADNFAGPRVHFSPHRLFELMRWSVNGRSYDRLGQVLLRMKSLTILYENAWWDPSGRRYQAELATGIVAEYRLLKSKIRRKPNESPPSYVHWTPHFYGNLAAGNLKKLDLDRLFALGLPTSQRLYRFLDKRFYRNPEVEIDLRDLACGHLGVTTSPNVAELKRRIDPAVAELVAQGFLEPDAPEARYRKVRTGIWRVRFRRAGAAALPPPVAPDAPPDRPPEPAPPARGTTPAQALVAAFYEAWSPGVSARPKPSALELSQAGDLLIRLGGAVSPEVVATVVREMRSKFPDARRFGASLPYFEAAARAVETRRVRREGEDEATRRRQADRDDDDRRRREDEALFAAWWPRWSTLAETARRAIVAAVLSEHPYLDRPVLRQSRVANRLYLEEMNRRSTTQET